MSSLQWKKSTTNIFILRTLTHQSQGVQKSLSEFLNGKTTFFRTFSKKNVSGQFPKKRSLRVHRKKLYFLEQMYEFNFSWDFQRKKDWLILLEVVLSFQGNA